MTGNNNNSKGVEATGGDDDVSLCTDHTGLLPIDRQRRVRYTVSIIISAVLLLLSLAGIVTLVRGGASTGTSNSRSQRGDISVPKRRTHTPIKDQLSRRRRRRLSEVAARRHNDVFTPQQQQQQQQQQQKRTRSGTFRVVERYPHDPDAFTQGLQMVNATHYYESLGIYGKSAIRMVKLSTGETVMETKMSNEYFGEGMCQYTTAAAGGTGTGSSTVSRLIQITWKEQDALIYNSKTLKELGRMSFTTSNDEGWGITFDTAKDVLYVSDGSSNLHTWSVPTTTDSDTTTIETTTEVQVYKKRRNRPRIEMTNLNELEYDDADGTVLANIWQQDTIIRINPRTGFVKKIYNMSSLYPRNERSDTADVLNGIAKVPSNDAADGATNEFLIAGKKWPWIYRVRLDE